jgi:putative spermidine/putrescine transport system substrate-binding protein
VQAGLWFCGWPDALPNARYVDLTDPAVATDFGVPVDGCESAWQRSSSALVYDGAQLGAADVASLPALEAWARANPGRFTYAAPPDFTGALAVRTFLYDEIGGDPASLTAVDGPVADGLWNRLNALEPALWRAGETYPTSQDAVEQLFSTGEIAAYFTYGPGTVAARVADGTFPDGTRSAVLDIGNIGNVSHIAIPADSPDTAAALVLADLLQDPATQLRFYADAGIDPVIELDRLEPAQRQQFAAVPVAPSVLAPDVLAANARPELAAEVVQQIEDGWITEVLQR